MPGLGRIFQFDDKNLDYPMQAALPAVVELPDYRYYSHFSVLDDQYNTGLCVGHGWQHWKMYPPVADRTKSYETVKGYQINAESLAIYKEACKRDIWSGNNNFDPDFGTSVLAAAQGLADPNGPFAKNGKTPIAQYLWAYQLEPMIQWLLSGKGVVVIGVNVYTGMFYPDASGFIKISGSLAGGHCMVVDGVNNRRGVVRLANSWGTSWGRNGRAYMSFEDMARLINEDGEICTAVEQKVI